MPQEAEVTLRARERAPGLRIRRLTVSGADADLVGLLEGAARSLNGPRK